MHLGVDVGVFATGESGRVIVCLLLPQLGNLLDLVEVQLLRQVSSRR